MRGCLMTSWVGTAFDLDRNENYLNEGSEGKERGGHT